MAKLNVGDKVTWVIANKVRNELAYQRLPAIVLSLPERHTAQIETQVHERAYKATVKRSHLEGVGAPQAVVARAVAEDIGIGARQATAKQRRRRT